MKKSTVRYIVLPFLVIIILSIVAVSYIAFQSQRSSYLKQIRETLEYRALLIIRQNPHIFDPSDTTTHFDKNLYTYHTDSVALRVTTIRSDGVVILDTEENPADMDNHKNRDEVKSALVGQTGQSIRFSNTIKREMMYLALPVMNENNNIIGVVRTSLAISDIDSGITEVKLKIFYSALIISVLAIFISIFISQQISRPLVELKEGVEQFARGELNRKLYVTGSNEIDHLNTAINEMAQQLNERINTITRQHNEQQAILTSMTEGVIAIDSKENIFNVNGAALDLLHLNKNILGRPLREAIRIPKVHQIVESIKDEKASELLDEFTLFGSDEKFIQIQGSPIINALGQNIGGLLVFNDLTRIKELENIRRDFVANVSHELKTPITSIKGFVETLLDGAKDNKEELDKFLSIISKQTNRLNSIINDLLSLSGIEQQAEKSQIDFKDEKIADLVRSSVQNCQLKAEQKKIKVNISVDDDLVARMNFQLMEQAVTNLIDNAIKYSNEKTEVNISAGKVKGNGIVISVEDFGSGIPEEHHARLFERFYRVDKARSRQMGGTGLGLSIVKHIILAHNGRISVTSEVGSGSTFSLHIPC